MSSGRATFTGRERYTSYVQLDLNACDLRVDVLQLAEALRVLRITTRKIRTVLWYWLYWSTNAASNRVPLIARHQDDQIGNDHHGYYTSHVDEIYKQVDERVEHVRI
jgi:hypothetical protein